MNLHLDKIAFEKVIGDVSKQSGVRRDVLEKDYYVTLLLFELTQLEKQGYAYFKGGTALYKALRSIRRFSEDIDLTVYVEDCPNASQMKKRLEAATLKYKSLQKGKTIENQRGTITCEYLYDSLFEFDNNDALQRFGKVKIEGTSFTVSEPTEKMEIAPHLYELCGDEYRRILRELYGVVPFVIETISLERIFIDKVFATEFYFERGEFGDVAKHVYDLTVLLQNEKIVKFLNISEEVQRIVSLKRKEELIRKGGVDSDMRIADFPYFEKLRNVSSFEKSFYNMQDIYVLNKDDIIPIEQALDAITKIRGYMNMDC